MTGAGKPEVIYAVRRADGDLMGDYSFSTVDVGDWTPAEDDSESADDPIAYEMVRMTVEVIATRTLPHCRECDEPARHWGLCETHARKDDPDAFPDCGCGKGDNCQADDTPRTVTL